MHIQGLGVEDHETLISAEGLAAALQNPTLRILDCRFDLLQPEAGRQAYVSSHIPGATYAHLDHDLAGSVTPVSGRHPLPAVESLNRFLGQSGIDASIQVVVYDDSSGALAARAWWLLRWLGHRRAAVLDGGFARWQSLGLPTTAGTEVMETRQFDGQAHPEKVIETPEVVAVTERRAGLQLVDARDATRFRGEHEPIDTAAGHIPGAVNLPFSRSIADSGLWKDSAALRQLWAETLPEHAAGPIGVMCGSGVTACQLVLSSLLAGNPEPRVYVGSWSEWIRDPGRAVAIGAA